ncbi:hypothetical protein VTK73DRAFT_6607 [Phialemonium thermophilum]|uniref:SUR7 protein n=1 Tax=Phialemonium thermophilum TaxID=223376 RepID=A0ABR3WIX0_9PEZI
MANFGRFVCVALPFALTVGSLIAMLVAALAGVTDKSLFLFQVNTTGLSISPASISNLIESRSTVPLDIRDGSSAAAAALNQNITAADLALYDLYDVGLWGYCYVPQNGKRKCTKPEFNWAQKELNMTKNNFETLVTSTGEDVKLPKQISEAITTFGTVIRWTEVVFIIALVSLAVELFFGIFSTCSRACSCLAFIVSAVATLAVCAAAAMSTAVSAIVVGAIEASAKKYGVTADMNVKYLAAVWIGAAFSIAAGCFWLFTICCCAPDHYSRKGVRHRDSTEGEKLIAPSSYQPIHEDPGFGYNRPVSGPQYGYPTGPHQPRRDLAYEPYSHANV